MSVDDASVGRCVRPESRHCLHFLERIFGHPSRLIRVSRMGDRLIARRTLLLYVLSVDAIHRGIALICSIVITDYCLIIAMLTVIMKMLLSTKQPYVHVG